MGRAIRRMRRLDTRSRRPRWCSAIALIAIRVGIVIANRDLRDASVLAEHSQQVLAASDAVQRLTVDLRKTGCRGWQLTDDRQSWSPRSRRRRSFPGGWRAGAVVRDDPVQAARVRSLAAGVQSYVDDYVRPALTMDPSQLTLADRRATTEEGKRRLDSVRDEFDAIRRTESTARRRALAGRARLLRTRGDDRRRRARPAAGSARRGRRLPGQGGGRAGGAHCAGRVADRRRRPDRAREAGRRRGGRHSSAARSTRWRRPSNPTGPRSSAGRRSFAAPTPSSTRAASAAEAYRDLEAPRSSRSSRSRRRRSDRRPDAAAAAHRRGRPGSAQQIKQRLLDAVRDRRSRFVVIDVTGVRRSTRTPLAPSSRSWRRRGSWARAWC